MSKVELKNIKQSAFASRETPCFEASVYVDGVKIGNVSNDGHGGCNLWHPWAAEKTVKAIAQALPKYAKEEFEVADQLIGDLLMRHAIGKVLARDLKSKLVYERADGSLGVSKKLNPAQLAQLSNPTWVAKCMVDLKAKRQITDLDQAVDLYLAKNL